MGAPGPLPARASARVLVVVNANCANLSVTFVIRGRIENKAVRSYLADFASAFQQIGMLDLARHIVGRKCGHFDPSKFEDHYEAALLRGAKEIAKFPVGDEKDCCRPSRSHSLNAQFG
jgi:non-homologous end joining protein Ku